MGRKIGWQTDANAIEGQDYRLTLEESKHDEKARYHLIDRPPSLSEHLSLPSP